MSVRCGIMTYNVLVRYI